MRRYPVRSGKAAMSFDEQHARAKRRCRGKEDGDFRNVRHDRNKTGHGASGAARHLRVTSHSPGHPQKPIVAGHSYGPCPNILWAATGSSIDSRLTSALLICKAFGGEESPESWDLPFSPLTVEG